MISLILAAAITITPGPVDWDTLENQGYAFDCTSETIYVFNPDTGILSYYPMLNYEVDSQCGHEPNVAWNDSDFEYPLLLIDINAPAPTVPVAPTPEPAPEPEVAPEQEVVVVLEPIVLAPVVPANRVALIPEYLNQPV